MGGRSRAAAQLLSGKGFKEVYNLKGGIKAWQGLKAVGPAEMGMALLRGDETAEEIISIAYGMEAGLGEFYSMMAETADDREVATLLTKLLEIEGSHKNKLFNLYQTFAPDVTDQDEFEAKIDSEVMEGGFTTKEFFEQNKNAMETAADGLIFAMMLETQALDLYLRYSQKTQDEKSKAVLLELADDEKAHLAALGRRMDTRA